MQGKFGFRFLIQKNALFRCLLRQTSPNIRAIRYELVNRWSVMSFETDRAALCFHAILSHDVTRYDVVTLQYDLMRLLRLKKIIVVNVEKF